jgi:hypothetical protein
MRHLISSLLLLSSLEAFALSQEELNANIALMRTQVAEVQNRMQRNGDRCDRMFAPLPGPNNTQIQFHTATAVIEHLGDKLQQGLSEECLNILLQNIATITPQDASTRAAIAQLANMTRPGLGSIPAQQIACTPEPTNIDSLEGIISSMQKISGSNECRPVTPGRAKLVDGRSPYGASNQYLLMQETPGSFRIVLNVDYQMKENASVSSAQMLQRAKGCLAAANGAFRGPNNTSLQIDLLSPQETSQLNIDPALRPPVRNVTIDPGNVGSTSANYQQNINCSTLVHETLHLLGLCDEYSGGRDGFICRARGPETSIMSSDYTAFTNAVPRRVTCQCEDSDLCETVAESPAALQFIQYPRFDQFTNVRFRNNYCTESRLRSSYVRGWQNDHGRYPAEPVRIGEVGNGGVAWEELSFDEDGDVIGKRYDCPCSGGDVAACQEAARSIREGDRRPLGHDCPAFTAPIQTAWGATTSPAQATSQTLSFNVTPPADRSLLLPSHFQRITNGTCASATPRYNACARHAYETDPAKCAEAPDYCQTDGWLQEATP